MSKVNKQTLLNTTQLSLNKLNSIPISLVPKVIALIICLFFINGLFAQVWMDDEISKGRTPNFFTIKEKFNDYWKDKNTNEEENGYEVFKRWENYWESRVYLDGSFPVAGININNYKRYLKENKNITNRGSGLNGNWSSLGPDSTVGGYHGIGRINSIAFHPTNPNIIFIGAAGGGLWKTVNGGSNWTTSTDNIATLGVSGIIVVPSNPNIMYIATGDGDGRDNYSVGVLKSIDGGDTWSITGLDWSSSSNALIRKIIIDPNDENTLMIASNYGIYKTGDAGANWYQVISDDFYDIEANPDAATNIFYASSEDQIYKSSDNGDNWTNIQSISDSRRIALAVSATNPTIVYALSASITNYGFNGLFKSNDSGDSYASQSTIPNILGWEANGSDIGGQGWYDLALTVDPTNENIIFTGGINNWKSINSGVDWELNTSWNGVVGVPEVHADKHAFEWNNGILYSGCDGGIYKTNNGGVDWTDISSDIVISQMYRLGVSKADTKVITGLQDNGTKLKSIAGIWSDQIGGDGMECAINPTTPSTMYGEYQLGQINRTTDDGAIWINIHNNLPGNDTGAWITPYQLDPIIPTTIYAAYSVVYKSTNQGDTWSAISPKLTGYNLTILNVAPSNPNYIYAGSYGSLYRTVDGGVNWSPITVPGTRLAMLVIHPTNPDILWAVLQNYNSGEKVFKSIDGGMNWSNITGFLPNLPVNCIAYAKNTQDGLYIGMDVGIYYTDNNLGYWMLYSEGLPNVEISELEIKESEKSIYAATYGRGLWKSDLFPSTCINTSQFPGVGISLTQTNLNGTVQTITTNQWGGEYYGVTNVLSGNNYQFASSDTSDYLTIRSGSYDGPIVIAGITPVNVINTTGDDLYIHTNTDSLCGKESIDRTSTAQCTSCICTGASFISGPTNQVSIIDSIATFSITVSGTPPFTYQWYEDSAVILLATDSTYTTPPLNINDTGKKYACSVTNCSGSYWTMSDFATLTVISGCTPVSILTQPANQVTKIDSIATFSVQVNGTPPFDYQWYVDSVPIISATDSTYTTPILNSNDSGKIYYCLVTNCSGNFGLISSSAMLTVLTECNPVSISGKLKDQTIYNGNTAIFSLDINGTPAFTYQWYKNNGIIPGANSSTYTTPKLYLGDDGNKYFCIVTNCSGSKQAISDTATVNVISTCDPIIITKQPTNQIAKIGNTATFNVAVSGTSPASYLWYKLDKTLSLIPGANSSSYTTPILTEEDNGNIFLCYITNCNGSKSAITVFANLTVIK